MRLIEQNLFDKTRNRKVPILIYTPADPKESLPVVIFNPGYQEQERLKDPKIPQEYKVWAYLAEYFVSNGYAFIAIQHDILGDNDGLEFIDKSAPQVEARKHLWVRGEQNILFVMNELKQKYPNFNLDQLIISGHSNGGDIAKFFANNRPEQISSIITFDARRCPIAPYTKQRLLMFEAGDSSTDIGVIPDEGTKDKPKRMDLEWVIIKPKDAVHISYCGDLISEELKQRVFKGLDFFLNV